MSRRRPWKVGPAWTSRKVGGGGGGGVVSTARFAAPTIPASLKRAMKSSMKCYSVAWVIKSSKARFTSPCVTAST